MDVNLGTNGLLTQIQSGIIDLGTNSDGSPRSITPSVGQTIVAGTENPNKSFFDVLGGALNAVHANELINNYIGGKIVKEQINDGVPVYTTRGNPSDQPQGKLLSDVATEQKNQARTFYLVGGGIVAALIAIYLVTRK